MIDSHCHLDCDAFEGDRATVLERAAARGVTDIIVPAVGEATFDPILRLRDDASPRCHAALGIHPVALPSMPPESDAAVLARLAARLERGRVVAVGECGLDVSIDLGLAPLGRQEAVLRAQLALAEALGLPVILHARGHAAYVRLLELLSQSALRGVIHSYGGGIDLVRPFSELGLYFGFAGPATYPNARKVRSSIGAVPLDRLLAETDAPDQTPEPYRPGRSEPAYVAEVIAALAEARQVTASEMLAITTQNAKKLFSLR